MRESRLKKFMLERGMKGYDSIFVIGIISFILIYFFTKSVEAALTIAVFFWVISLAIYICYHFELADDYYRKVKAVKHPKGSYLSNILIFISIFVLGFGGAIAGAFLCIWLFGYNGITVGISGGLGIALTIKLFHHFILKKL